MLVHNILKSVRRISNEATSVITLQLRAFIINNRMRLFATESTAIQKIRIREMRTRKQRHNFGSYFLLVIPVSSFGLGTWQVFRKFEKDAEIAKYMEKVKQPPVDLPKKTFTQKFMKACHKSLDELKEMEFCAVRVKGRFDHSKEIYMGPRPKIDKYALTKPPSLLSNTKGGYLVITPFTLSDRNLTIMVNRGWVPQKEKLPKTRPEGQITEEVELIGLVRNHERRRPFGSKNSPEKGIWVYRDLERMSEITGAAPVFLDAVLASTVPGGPLGGQTILQIPNDHLSYLITWYSLSGVSFYMWYLKNMQKLSIVV